MKMKRYLIVLCSVALLFGCTSESEVNSEKPLIVCTTNIISNTIENLVGSSFNVVSLMGPGVDPHLYKASQKDLEYLQKADLVVMNGLHLEGKMAEVLTKLARTKKVISMSDGLDEEEFIKVAESTYDPHIWYDVLMWNKACQFVSNDLVNAFPDLKDSITAYTTDYQKELLELNLWVLDQINLLDSAQRILITAHDAFSYFGRAYQFEVKGLQGISTQSEYGLQDISALVNYITEKKVKAVFVETSVPEKPLRAVIEGCREKGFEVHIGGALYSDALGGPNDPGNNYINTVKHNVKSIVSGLK